MFWQYINSPCSILLVTFFFIRHSWFLSFSLISLCLWFDSSLLSSCSVWLYDINPLRFFPSADQVSNFLHYFYNNFRYLLFSLLPVSRFISYAIPDIFVTGFPGNEMRSGGWSCIFCNCTRLGGLYTDEQTRAHTVTCH